MNTYYSNSSNIRIVFATNIRISKTTIRPTLICTAFKVGLGRIFELFELFEQFFYSNNSNTSSNYSRTIRIIRIQLIFEQKETRNVLERPTSTEKVKYTHCWTSKRDIDFNCYTNLCYTCQMPVLILMYECEQCFLRRCHTGK